MTKKITQQEIQDLAVEAIHEYFEACRARVPAFVQQHYRYPGAWRTNRRALGLDLLRAPINLFWAPVFGVLSVVRIGLQLLRWQRAAALLGRVPEGFNTQVQHYLGLCIRRDLMRLDCDSDSLEAHITRKLSARFGDAHPDPQEQQAFFHRAAAIVHEALQEYRVTRTASSDITNTITSTLVGAAAFQKFTPGGIGIGFLIAALVARYQAEHDFFLGKTLGRFYYQLFPPTPSWQLTAAALTLVLVLLACFASFSGLVTDPIQARLGLHRVRLQKMLSHLERDISAQTASSFRPKDQYVARILDLFDAVKSHLS
ncbi:DUF6635 family protein [Teredinibacter turnerae]|uniref:DUF6635 family protein n=1 Tax=Teredinibacter turnerae TaxID=2426 RepID=UPI0002DB91A5|nr:DUF6635 family protein [Teredinibacter turnerae]